MATTAGDGELAALTALVEEKLAAVLKPGRPVTKQAMLLVALALAHDVREHSARADAILAKSTDALGRLLERVDGVLAQSDELAMERQGDAARSEPKAAAGCPRDVVRVDAARRRPIGKERRRE